MSQTSHDILPEALTMTDLCADEYHELLAAEERRVALEVLEGQTTPVTVRNLAVELTERTEDDLTAEETTVQQMATVLHHVHLPKMADLGVIEYDPTKQLVPPTGNSPPS